MSLVIRDATEADLPAILALHNHHIARTTAIWRTVQVDLAERRAWFAERRAKGFPVVVAERDDAFLGYASYGPFRTGDGYDGTVENSVYVMEEAQGKGVARSLMEALIVHAAADGRHTMMAGIGLPNEASVALHRKLGFHEAALLRGIGRKFGRSLDLMLMQRPLP
jgi:phosphinothricin acetyltransferase